MEAAAKPTPRSWISRARRLAGGWCHRLRWALAGPAGRVFALGLLVPLLAVAMHVTDSILINGTLLSFNGEWTIPTYLTAGNFAAAGIAALVAGWRRPEERFAWTVVGGLALLFAAEELALQLHERSEELLSQKPLLVLEAAFGVALLLALRGLARRLPAAAVILLVASLVTLVFAEGSALVANLIRGIEPVAKPRNLLIIAEEGGEVLTATWVLAAALPFATRRARPTNPRTAARSAP